MYNEDNPIRLQNNRLGTILCPICEGRAAP